jgi:hypothetical protein
VANIQLIQIALVQRDMRDIEKFWWRMNRRKVSHGEVIRSDGTQEDGSGGGGGEYQGEKSTR